MKGFKVWRTKKSLRFAAALMLILSESVLTVPQFETPGFQKSGRENPEYGVGRFAIDFERPILYNAFSEESQLIALFPHEKVYTSAATSLSCREFE